MPLFHPNESTFADDVVAKYEESGSWIEAVLEVCELRGMDPEGVGRLLTPEIRMDLEDEANRKHMMKTLGDTPKIPFV